MEASVRERSEEAVLDRAAADARLHAAAPDRPSHATWRWRAHCLMVIAVLLEITLILPFVDHLADANSTIHFTQHGCIFLGGVLMGFALRDMHAMSRS
jgi:hypothetical protein